MKKTIYKDNLETSREIWIEIEDGRLTMYMQDLGPACVMMTGEEEYEREVSCSLSELAEVLGVNSEEGVMSMLEAKYDSPDSLDRFSEYLCKSHVKYEYYCC